MSRRQAEASFDGLDAHEEDVFALQEAAVRRAERHTLDHLVEDVDRELAHEELAVSVRLSHDFTDQRRARRASRRAGRAVVRSLPRTLSVDDAAGVGAERGSEAA